MSAAVGWRRTDGIRQAAGLGFLAGGEHRAAAFNGRLWVVGGIDDDAGHSVWSSENGIDWTRQTTAAGFSARYGHQLTVLHDRLWVVGGARFDGTFGFEDPSSNEVWSSADGTHWRLGYGRSIGMR